MEAYVSHAPPFRIISLPCGCLGLNGFSIIENAPLRFGRDILRASAGIVISFAAPLDPVNPDPDIRPSAKEITSRRQAKVLPCAKICGGFKNMMIPKFNRYKYELILFFASPILDGLIVVHVGCCPWWWDGIPLPSSSGDACFNSSSLVVLRQCPYQVMVSKFVLDDWVQLLDSRCVVMIMSTVLVV